MASMSGFYGDYGKIKTEVVERFNDVLPGHVANVLKQLESKGAPHGAQYRARRTKKNLTLVVDRKYRATVAL